MRATFLNHACVKFESGPVGVLCDPWLDGSAFNNGWDLLVKTPFDLAQALEGVTHVWISHEHPDHFVPRHLSAIAKTHADRITILFQKTRDGRVKGFCESKGLRVREMETGERVDLGSGVAATCGAFDFYDSWLHLSDGRSSMLNLNDCAMDGRRDLARIRETVGSPDVLFTQFSYAAWKGGRDRRDYRAFAARRKLATITAQIAELRPRFTVPFASMVYFSNRENAYLNDAVNDVAVAVDAIRAAGSRPVAMFPGDAWEIGEPHDDAEALRKYADVYASLATLPLRDPGKSVPLEELRKHFDDYRARIFSKNSEKVIRALRRVPGAGVFQPLFVRLSDLDLTVSVSVADGFDVASGAPDVTMHSSSLDFVFTQEFGYDTLTVNGRFESTPAGFAKMTKSLAIGSLNAMGLSISTELAKNAGVVLLLLRKLAGVMARLRAPAAAS